MFFCDSFHLEACRLHDFLKKYMYFLLCVQSYCEKHMDVSRPPDSPPPNGGSSIDELLNVTNDPSIWLSEIKPSFIEHTFGLPQYTAQGIFYYWRLKKMVIT